MEDLKALELDPAYDFNSVKMYCYRKNGVTLAHIAKKFGCSSETVRRRVDKIKKKLALTGKPTFVLSPRAQNGLYKMFGKEVTITKELVRAHYDQNPKCFLRQKNMGPKAHEEVVKWISEK